MADRDARSRFEDEGIPDLQDGTPEQQWAGDPQELPLPGDEPMAVDDYGTTAAEQEAGEPLDLRLAREQPDPAPEPDDPYSPWPPWEAADETAGRLVDEDEGVRPHTEPEAVAWDAGPDGGGYSAEEDAVHVRRE